MWLGKPPLSTERKKGIQEKNPGEGAWLSSAHVHIATLLPPSLPPSPYNPLSSNTRLTVPLFSPPTPG